MKKVFVLFFFGILYLSCAACLSAEHAPVPRPFESAGTDEAVDSKKNEPFSFTSFGVTVREKAVVITWSATHEGRNIIIYRSSAPFDSVSSLAGAVPVTNLKDTGTPFIDYPVPNISFYYAVLEESQLDNADIRFIMGKNTTNTPVTVMNGQKNTEPFSERATPLPFLNPEKTEKKPPEFFSSETEEAVSALASYRADSEEPFPEREPYIFPTDRQSPDGGEAMELQRILKESFLPKDWHNAEKEFNSFLKIRRTAKVSARTQFYLGEVFFFQKKYAAALLKFLLVQDTYEALSAEWIRHCLIRLADSSQ